MKTDYEVAIIGGGIQGAGMAQACAAANYNTVVIEQNDWGSGTSCKSSKLIHGGLRYLESAQIPLVWQSLKERKLLLNNAPTLVKPLEFLIPVYRATHRRPWELLLGLSLYSLLAGLTPLARFKWSRKKPALLKQDNFQMTFGYWDAQTDDQALTRAVIYSASKLGAETLRPGKLIRAEKQSFGYQLTVQFQGSEYPINCQHLVNCAGPWINQVMDTIVPKPAQPTIELIKGSHLVLRDQISDQAFYLESPIDQRAVFLLPWYGRTLLGTTEVEFTGDPGGAEVSQQEIDYLLATARYYFPHLNADIIDQFAGLRVLPHSNESAFSRSREPILFQDKRHPRLISLYGGKLTTYRHTAEKTVQQIARVLGKRKAIADTKKIKLKKH